MKIIILNVASRGLYVLKTFGTLIFAMILTFMTFNYLPIDLNKLIFIGIFMGLWFLLSKVTKRLPKGQVKLELSQSGIEVKWLKQFLFHNKRDVTLHWGDIKDYMVQPDQYFNLFRIRMNDKRKFKFNMDDDNEDFDLFYSELEEAIASQKQSGNVSIKRAKNVYESNYGLISAIVLGIIMIGGVITILAMKPKGEPNYGVLFASLAGGVFFIIQVFRARKRSKEEK